VIRFFDDLPRGETISTNPRYPVPEYVRYRGKLRKVYGVETAKHKGQSHRHYVLRYKRGHAPESSATGAMGHFGQRNFIAVYVRSDHCVPVWTIERTDSAKGGRPKHPKYAGFKRKKARKE